MPKPSKKLQKSLQSLKKQGVPFARISDLRPWADNPRHNAEAIPHVLKSMQRFGWTNPILVRAEDDMVEAGHTRLTCATHLGLDEVPIIRLEHAEGDVKLYAIADNRTHEFATWTDGLVGILDEFEIDDIIDVGFESLTEAKELVGTEGTDDEDKEGRDVAPEPPPVEPITKVGDVWRLGDHLLVCGDSTDPAVAARIVGPGEAEMLFTDPPYGVDYKGTMNKERKAIGNDAHKDMVPFLSKAFAVAFDAVAKGGAWYVCAPSGPPFAQFASAMPDGVWRQTISWVKHHFVLGRSDFHMRHESIFYGWKPGAAHRWRGGHSQTSVWEFDKPARSDDHPTMKPVPLVEHAIKLSSERGDIVLDLFGGSGTTLLACENTGRHARLVELSPGYCDVIVRRWEELTGQGAERVEDDG